MRGAIDQVLKDWQSKGIIDLPAREHKAAETVNTVTDNTQLQHVTYTLAVTHAQCHKCGCNIADDEPVIWRKCWCQGETKRVKSLYVSEEGRKVAWGPGHCRGTPQPFCLDCFPRDFASWKRRCLICGRAYYIESSITGRRCYCSGHCVKVARAKRERD
jgi:predicted Zn-ribbon and HTH transcriptional regulator